jgi:hypothetical protein
MGLSDRRSLTLLVFLNAVCENALWYGPIIEWIRIQGRVGGRSWRSQVSPHSPTTSPQTTTEANDKIIAVMSILLAPAFFLSSTQNIM